MGHDASKVLMGATRMNSKEVTEHLGSPSTFLAGLALRQHSNGSLSVTKADGGWLGISLGKGLSDAANSVAICRDGLSVPVLLENAPARGIVEITDYTKLVSGTDDTLKIGATTFTFKESVSTENEVLCAASGSSNAVVAAALVAKINAHSVAGPLFKATNVGAVVTITAKNNATLGASIDLVYTDGDSNVGLTVDDVTFTGGGAAADYVAIGSKVYFSDTTGKADDPNSGATISDAIYVSGVLTGIQEDGSEAACALVDFTGGL